MKNRAVILGLLLIAAAACSRPRTEEMYVRADDRAADGSLVFRMQLADTSEYALQLFTMMDCRERVFRNFHSMRMVFGWESPSGKSAADTVFIDRSSLSGDTFYNKRFSTLYRSGICPSESGEWRISVKIDESIINRYSVAGVGLRLEKN